MSKNRQTQIPNYTPREERKKVEEITLNFSPCIVCDKEIKQGYYARWSDGGVCCKECNAIQEQIPKNWGG